MHRRRGRTNTLGADYRSGLAIPLVQIRPGGSFVSQRSADHALLAGPDIVAAHFLRANAGKDA